MFKGNVKCYNNCKCINKTELDFRRLCVFYNFLNEGKYTFIVYVIKFKSVYDKNYCLFKNFRYKFRFIQNVSFQPNQTWNIIGTWKNGPSMLHLFYMLFKQKTVTGILQITYLLLSSYDFYKFWWICKHNSYRQGNQGINYGTGV
jgi:hypothetical protein